MLTPEIDQTGTSPSVSTRALASFVMLGVAFDLALHGQRPGVSVPLLVLVFVGAAWRWLPRSIGDDLLLGAAVVLSVFPALLANEGLIALDMVATVALVALATARDERGMLRATIASLLRRTGHVLAVSLRVPAMVLAPLARALARLPLGRWRGVARALAIAVPIVVIFAALLASADAVFGELLIPSLPDVDLSGAAAHVGLVVVGIAGAATLWLSAQRRVSADVFEQPSLLPTLRATDVVTVLLSLDLLFALFVGVQFAVLFGGHERVEVTPGLTYAEYARSGFFQLIAVAGLVVALILAAWDMGERRAPRDEQRFRLLVTIMVGLCGVILASALMRLALYEQTFGFTLNRLAGYLAIGLIGFVLVALLIAIWTGARDRVVALLLAGCLLTLVTANIINPDRFVAERNTARFERTGTIDIDYLGSALGADAVPVMTGLLSRLSEPEASGLRIYLCEQLGRLAFDPGWRSANLARASAGDALARAGVDEASCARPPDLAG